MGTGTSYALPDLSSSGFPVPATGDTVGYQASALYSNKSLGTLLAAPNLWKVLATPGTCLRFGSKDGELHRPLREKTRVVQRPPGFFSDSPATLRFSPLTQGPWKEWKRGLSPVWASVEGRDAPMCAFANQGM